MERLQKVIAQAGVCSRRKAEEYIRDGKVSVNGEVVTEMGVKVSGNDLIEVNGKELTREDKVYYVINKPKGCLCTAHDEKGRKSVLDFAPKDKRIYPVGRLDWDTSGVLFLTNDGDFTNKMIHPRYHLPKRYLVNLQGLLTEDDIRRLRKGLVTADEKYGLAKIRVLDTDITRERTRFEMTIYEGKNHQVKNMMKGLGYEVRRLHRVQVGFIDVDGMKPGEYRKLKPFEVKKLMQLASEGENE